MAVQQLDCYIATTRCSACLEAKIVKRDEWLSKDASCKLVPCYRDRGGICFEEREGKEAKRRVRVRKKEAIDVDDVINHESRHGTVYGSRLLVRIIGSWIAKEPRDRNSPSQIIDYLK